MQLPTVISVCLSCSWEQNYSTRCQHSESHYAVLGGAEVSGTACIRSDVADKLSRRCWYCKGYGLL